MKAIIISVLSTLAICLHAVSLAEAADTDFDAKKMLGEWAIVSSEKGGEKAPPERLQSRVVITAETLTIKGDGGDFVMKYKVDASEVPVRIELTITDSPFGGGAVAKGIVEVSESQLRLCYADEGGDAPKKFASESGAAHRLIVLKREKK